MFLLEAAKYYVFPMDDRFADRMNPEIAGRDDLMAGRTSITLRPSLPGLREDAAPNVKNTSFTIEASVDIPAGPADGVIVAQGGRFAGWSLYVKDGIVTYCHNLCNVERFYVRAQEQLTEGTHTIRFRFDYDGGGVGLGGNGTIEIDGIEAGQGRIGRTTPYFYSMSETLDVGVDRGTPVTAEYPSGKANAFSGTVNWVRLDIDGPGPSISKELAEAALSVH
jgi:arylsulfatase